MTVLEQAEESSAAAVKSVFLQNSRNAILATNRLDGAPQLSPVWFRWTSGQFVISVGRNTAKNANIRRDPRVTICVDDPAGGRYLVASGPAQWIDEAIDREEALALVAKYLPADEVLPYWERIERTEPQWLFTLRPTQLIWRGF